MNDEDIFDPQEMNLSLTKEEKLRATALLLATRYYIETICKDGNLYQAMVNRGVTLTPATSVSLVRIAGEFENYLLGKKCSIASVEIGGEEYKPSPDSAAIE